MSAIDLGVNEVLGVSRIEGPLVFVEGIGSVGYDEVVEISTRAGANGMDVYSKSVKTWQ